jgi:hypothetical protein
MEKAVSAKPAQQRLLSTQGEDRDASVLEEFG